MDPESGWMRSATSASVAGVIEALSAAPLEGREVDRCARTGGRAGLHQPALARQGPAQRLLRGDGRRDLDLRAGDRRGGRGPLVRRAGRAHADQLRRGDRPRAGAHGGDERSRRFPAGRRCGAQAGDATPSCARSSGAWSTDCSAARWGSGSGWPTRRRHRAGRFCRCSGSPRATTRPPSCISAAHPAQAARTARRGCWKRSR